MKICLMTTLFDPFVNGVGKHVTMLAEALSKRHDVIVISAMDPRMRTQNESNSRSKLMEINSENINSLYTLVRISSSMTDRAINSLLHHQIIWNPIAYLEIKKILANEKPDIVHTHTVKNFSPSVFAAIQDSGIPHVHTLHDYELISWCYFLFRNGKAISKFNLLDRIYIWYRLRTSLGVDTVISPSKFTMDMHTKLGFFKNSKKHVIPHGLISNNEAIPKKAGGKEFLFIGRIEEYKGPHVAVKAFKGIQNKDARLHIVGKGKFLDVVKQIAEGDERIIFHGFVQNNDLIQIFEKCSFAILPSLWDDVLPYTILEVMNKGLPVITSNMGGIPEMIKNGYNGFLVNPGDVNTLRHLMESLMNNEETLIRLSKNAIEASKKFSMEEHIKNILNVYSEICFRQY